MNDKTISILGCGWLGLPLAEKLQVAGYQVKGSTTNKKKLKLIAEKNIDPHLVYLNPDVKADNIQKFLDSKILVINIPPQRDKNVMELFPAQIKSLIEELKKSPIEFVLFISSTSVYGNNNKKVTEESELNPERASGKALVIAEGLLRAEILMNPTILRFGGLIGPDRDPTLFLTGKKEINNSNAKVNLIHLDDSIEIILRIIKQNLWMDIFNAAADEHPTRKELYTKAAKKLGVVPPKFTNEIESYKIVSSEKLKKELKYKFKFSDPMKMF